MVKQTNKITQNNKDYISALGRRKNATALVRLYKNDVTLFGGVVKKGEIVVNKKNALEYFGKDTESICREPLRITNIENKFAVSIKVTGGGNRGQLDAVVLGMARALDKFDREKFHTVLKRKGMLTRDSRIKERRKVGMGGKSRRKKQSPKR
ncbi:MAG: 30S ribosomal protein S9 [Candidatus Levybacteria bacterium]|nr:30S ribosomal protein S9 [Candidatus Levybacteria bacterium]